MLSPRVAALLARVGYHAAPAPGRRRTVRVRLGPRWLLRGTELPRIAQLIPRWGALSLWRRARIASSVRPVILYADPGAAPWSIVRIRDKERAKLSLFDLAGRTKTVVWEQREDLERELTTQDAFVAHGVPMIPFSRIDRERRCLTQPLRGDFLAHVDSLAPIADRLLAYAVATASPVALATIAADATRVLALPEAAAMREPVRAALAEAARGGVTTVPTTQVHGDLSSGNIVRAGGEAWLIDLDRARTAAASYDFIYAWVTRGERERALADRALGALWPDTTLSRAALARLGLALFIVDNLAYLAECAGERARKHTLQLVRAAASLLLAAAA